MSSKKSFFEKFKKGFAKTSGQIASIFTGNNIDDNVWDELEEKLITADMGAPLVYELLEQVKNKRSSLRSTTDLIAELRRISKNIFPEPKDTVIDKKPYIIMVIGVNGAGKTTSIAKIAKRYKELNKTVLMCAADTFRAAAVEQLVNWGTKLNIDVFTGKQGADPASVTYDAVITGTNKKYDIVIIDTAGRLHTKHNLMEEMKKINRVVSKAKTTGVDEIILVLDGTSGQNALSQAKVFNEAIPVDSIAITKLDGSAKGGVVLRIAHELKIPIKYVGLGEKADDLMDFDPEAYVEAIFRL